MAATTLPARLLGRAAGHPVAAFFLLAWSISWCCWLPTVLGSLSVLAQVLFFAGVLGPAAAAATVIRAEGGSVRPWLGRLARWRVSAWFYLYALGLPAGLLAVVNVELVLLGQPVDPSLLLERLPPFLGMAAFVAVLGGGLEELGWRSFALERLQERYHPLVATLVLGLGWGVWHLPLYGASAAGPLLFVVFYTYLYNRTGSVLLCLLLHATFTPALELLVLVPGRTYGSMDLGAIVTAATLAAASAVLVLLTRGRLGAAPGPGEPAGRDRTVH